MSEHSRSSGGAARRRPRASAGAAARGSASGRARRAGQARRLRPKRGRRGLILATIALVAIVAIMAGGSGKPRSFAPPSRAQLAGMSVGRRIVAIAQSQLGYRTSPSDSYCNKFSAYWGAGVQSCSGGETSEEWCADFAAWAWQKAGVKFSYGFAPGELNAAAASFYEWGLAHGTWHSAQSGYRAAPGDAAVYGLRLGVPDTAAHVAIVSGDPAGQRGPDVINGDGDRTGFSVVERGHDQLRADAGHGPGALLNGYVSPD